MSGPVGWLHGYTMSSQIWSELWSHLPGREHLGIDLPGHGAAAGHASPRTLDGWAEVVAEQLVAAGSRELVGLSFGSSIAVQVAANHPELLDRLILAAPTLSGVPQDRAARAKYLMLMMRLHELGPGPELARVWMNDPPPIFRGLRRYPQRYAAMAEVVARHTFGELRTGSMSALTATVQDPEVLGRIRARVLVIVGTEDMPQFQANAEALARHTPHGRVVVLPGAGHLPLLEEPQACAHLIEDFLTPLGQPPRAPATLAR